MRKPILIALTLSMLFCAALADGYVNMTTEPSLYQQDWLRVTLIDVGTSDCFLLQCGGKTMLLDCGLPGREETIVRELNRLGVTRLDYAVCTHPHDDHHGSFAAVLARVPADAYYNCFPVDETTEQKRTLAKIAETGTPILPYTENDTFDLSPATIKLLRISEKDAAQKHAGINDRSMLVHASLGERSILLAADAATFAQPRLVNRYQDALKADILKLPHHGIELDKRFLEAVSPELCLLTAVRSVTRYIAITMMEKRDIPYLIIPLGTTECVTDGETWRVYQFPNVPVK